jgi:hypothetical protein
MNDDYKKGYADAMGWKTENHLEHLPAVRNDVLEEVAKEFEKMKAFEKDTMASFAAYVRGMKR